MKVGLGFLDNNKLWGNFDRNCMLWLILPSSRNPVFPWGLPDEVPWRWWPLEGSCCCCGHPLRPHRPSPSLHLPLPSSHHRANPGSKEAHGHQQFFLLLYTMNKGISVVHGGNIWLDTWKKFEVCLNKKHDQGFLLQLFLMMRPTRTLDSLRALLPRLQWYWKTVRCGLLGAKVPTDRQEQQTKTLLMCVCWKHTCFPCSKTLQSLRKARKWKWKLVSQTWPSLKEHRSS